MLKDTDRVRPAALTFLEKGHYTSSSLEQKIIMIFGMRKERDVCMDIK